MKLRHFSQSFMVLSILLSITNLVHAAAFDLDTTFGTSGYMDDVQTRMAIQSVEVIVITSVEDIF